MAEGSTLCGMGDQAMVAPALLPTAHTLLHNSAGTMLTPLFLVDGCEKVLRTRLC